MKDFSPIAITSAVVGFPARIGVITRLDGTVIRFAESDESLVVDGDTYGVVPGLQVSAVTHTINGEMPSCEFVGVHRVGATFDSRDIDAGLFDGATVQLYKVNRENLSRKGLEFTGAISNISYDPVEQQVSFEVKGPASRSRVVMTQKRSPMCRTDLFSVLCGLNASSYDVATSVGTLTDAFSFTVTGSLTQDDGYFNQGVLITADGVAMEIAKWTESTQTIMTYLPCEKLVSEGLGLTLYPGCDKTMSATGCGKFSNWINFVGEPHWLGTAAAAQQVVSPSGDGRH